MSVKQYSFIKNNIYNLGSLMISINDKHNFYDLKLSLSELKECLSKLNNYCDYTKDEFKMSEINENRYDDFNDWINTCLLTYEENNDFEIILLMEELKHLEKPFERWLTVCLYNNKDNMFYFRRITNNNPIINFRTFKKSKNPKWFIDTFNVSTGYSFWQRLNELL